jgi:3-dehydroquinate dehydratase
VRIRIAGALAGRQRPVILACRAAWKAVPSGLGDEHRRFRAGNRTGAEFIDIEWPGTFRGLIARTGTPHRPVLARFRQMPVDLPERARAMRSTGAEVIKIAAQAKMSDRLLALLDVKTRQPGERWSI